MNINLFLSSLSVSFVQRSLPFVSAWCEKCALT